MPSRPPETEFYQRDCRYQLWRDISRLQEDYAGTAGEFRRVLNDVILALEPLPCQMCGTAVVNVAPDEMTKLQCPACGWLPVTIESEDECLVSN